MWRATKKNTISNRNSSMLMHEVCAAAVNVEEKVCNLCNEQLLNFYVALNKEACATQRILTRTVNLFRLDFTRACTRSECH